MLSPKRRELRADQAGDADVHPRPARPTANAAAPMEMTSYGQPFRRSTKDQRRRGVAHRTWTTPERHQKVEPFRGLPTFPQATTTAGALRLNGSNDNGTSTPTQDPTKPEPSVSLEAARLHPLPHVAESSRITRTQPHSTPRDPSLPLRCGRTPCCHGLHFVPLELGGRQTTHGICGLNPLRRRTRRTRSRARSGARCATGR